MVDLPTPDRTAGVCHGAGAALLATITINPNHPNPMWPLNRISNHRDCGSGSDVHRKAVATAMENQKSQTEIKNHRLKERSHHDHKTTVGKNTAGRHRV